MPLPEAEACLSEDLIKAIHRVIEETVVGHFDGAGVMLPCSCVASNGTFDLSDWPIGHSMSGIDEPGIRD